MSKLSDIYSNEAVKEFGRTLRKAIRIESIQDYATLTELENAEEPEQLADVLKRFLRRYEVHARKLKLKRPSEGSLEQIMQMAQDKASVQLLRAALISYALVKSDKDEEEIEEEVSE